MDKTIAIEKAKLFAEVILGSFRPKEIILFGSYSKGNWTENSDIDIAVIFDKIDEDKFKLTANLFKLRRAIHPLLEPIVFDLRHDPSGFLEHVMKTGIKLYPVE